MRNNNLLIRAISITFLVMVPSITAADIYMSIDSNGVLHFTNAPTSSQYRLYFKEHPKKKASLKSYDHLIGEASQAIGLPFHLLKALIRVESNFDSNAVSKKGAMGLMQIMPENIKALKIRDPFDPRDNIMGGAYYLKTLLNRFEGKLPLALAAYNAGPTIVDQYQAIPPIKETMDFVKKVMEFYYFYKQG
ncbi:MAG: transglycosylase SLT domain-containing protein [Deltaproteobacteria bacterium]|jgi:soluble lytic murein transglycosylase